MAKCRVYEKPNGRGWIMVIPGSEEEEENMDEMRAEQIIVEMLMSYTPQKRGGDDNGSNMDSID